ncbi:uncharacterized protein N7469_006136 [Penicillium citrinum]|uniref:C2H2-type domain-containing protein n=1 Tax=Penicillium citrinum TaxID=5077 RepID=A0A9W9TMG2_PENCI|nr:uncharacterized protein N7469_006136 [Penicillium citrinum]KAJ5231548.1 hypothetical protein N7469_006136 [Penicillium citrinum]
MIEYLGVRRSVIAGFEPLDRKHVAQKFPWLGQTIRDRLALAISQRRAILKYRERRNLKFDQGLNSVESTVLSETVATGLGRKRATDNSDIQFTTSKTSHAKTILSRRGGLSVSSPQSSHEGQPFKCRREYTAHLYKKHLVPEAGQFMVCPLCSSYIISERAFERHIGRHIQELALFVSPQSDAKTVITTFTRDQKTRWKAPEVLKKPNIKRWLLSFCKHSNTLKRSRPSKFQ